jgi:hypothetical protein
MKSTKAAPKTKSRSRATKANATTGKPPKSTPVKTRTRRGTATKVMGVTVPKTLTNALDTLINSPRGREILATALVAAASAAAAALMKSSDSREITKIREAAADAGNQATRDLSEAAAGAVAEIVSGAARALLPASLTSENKTKTKARS